MNFSFREKMNFQKVFTFLFFLTLTWAIFIIGNVVPPFQAPDESDHIERAYLLSSGEFFLYAPDGLSSGGYVDDGLSAFINHFMHLPFHPETRLTSDEVKTAQEENWTGSRTFQSLPGTGYYFPIIYAPQAVGLALGRFFGLTVHESYSLARILAQLVYLTLLVAAVQVARPHPAILAAAALPMTLFLASTAAIDHLTLGILVLLLSVIRYLIEAQHVRKGAFCLVAFLIFVLATSRPHLFSLYALLALFVSTPAWRTASITMLFSFACAFTWCIFAISTTIDLRAGPIVSKGEVLQYYLFDPVEFVRVVWFTVIEPGYFEFYVESAIGILGWLDTPLPEWLYVINICAFIVFAAVIFRDIVFSRAVLIFAVSGILGVILIFAALLMTWSSHPAQIILGIQGRYFLGPLLVIMAGASLSTKRAASIFFVFAITVLVVLNGVTTYVVLVERYYV